MNSLAAMEIGKANRGKELMVFDWDKAARLIRERGATEAQAGLESDWEWTGGTIFDDGKPDTNSYTYLASTWATPQLEIDNDIVDCFRMRSDTEEWDAHTKWPPSSLAILNGETP